MFSPDVLSTSEVEIFTWRNDLIDSVINADNYGSKNKYNPRQRIKTSVNSYAFETSAITFENAKWDFIETSGEEFQSKLTRRLDELPEETNCIFYYPWVTWNRYPILTYKMYRVAKEKIKKSCLISKEVSGTGTTYNLL